MSGLTRKMLPLYILGLACIIQMAPASGSVIMTGTRVIYPGKAQEHSVQLTNQDDVPNVVQAWVDTGNPDSTPDTADAPFMVTPPLFRMEPKAGQTLRLVFTGQNLPQDRESVFYLNTLQIPPMQAAHAGQNQFVVMLRNRVKLFYRPESIAGSAEQAPQQLRFGVGQAGPDWDVTVSNPSGYYVSLDKARVVSAGREVAFEPKMLAPRSETSYRIKGAGQLADRNLRVKFKFLNDYGSSVDGEYLIQP